MVSWHQMLFRVAESGARARCSHIVRSLKLTDDFLSPNYLQSYSWDHRWCCAPQPLHRYCTIHRGLQPGDTLAWTDAPSHIVPLPPKEILISNHRRYIITVLPNSFISSIARWSFKALSGCGDGSNIYENNPEESVCSNALEGLPAANIHLLQFDWCQSRKRIPTSIFESVEMQSFESTCNWTPIIANTYRNRRVRAQFRSVVNLLIHLSPRPINNWAELWVLLSLSHLLLYISTWDNVLRCTL